MRIEERFDLLDDVKESGALLNFLYRRCAPPRGSEKEIFIADVKGHFAAGAKHMLIVRKECYFLGLLQSHNIYDMIIC